MEPQPPKKLSPAQLKVMREGHEEPPFFGKHWDRFEAGSYACASCGTKLFSSEEKIDTGDGWPAFKKPLALEQIEFKKDPAPDGSVEIRCKRCQSRLGSVMPSGIFRVYSVALDFSHAPKIDIELPDDSDSDEKEEDTEKQDAVSKLRQFAGYIGATILGAAIGATGAYLVCQNFCAAPLAATQSTTTPAQATSTSGTSSTSPGSSSTTPRATTTPVTPVSTTSGALPASTTPDASAENADGTI